MEKYKKSTPFKLSGGQKQRIAIAGVVALKPKVIVLDESTAMLDPRGRKQVLAVMENLRKTENITIVLITHFMDESLKADRVVLMKKGEILLLGQPKEVFLQTEIIENASLKLPRAEKLSENLKEVGIDLGKIISEEELMEGLCNLEL